MSIADDSAIDQAISRAKFLAAQQREQEMTDRPRRYAAPVEPRDYDYASETPSVRSARLRASAEWRANETAVACFEAVRDGHIGPLDGAGERVTLTTIAERARTDALESAAAGRPDATVLAMYADALEDLCAKYRSTRGVRMTPPPIAVGQTWRRISDGAEVTVTLVDDSYIWYEYATGQTSYFRPSIFRARFDGPIGPQESK